MKELLKPFKDHEDFSSTPLRHCQADQQLQFAYLAGHFDGEGHVGLNRCGQRVPHITIKVANIFKPTLLEYASAFGGHINAAHHHGRMVWSWELLRQPHILSFISCILPYSKEKKAQLELAKQFIEERIRHPINLVPDSFLRRAAGFEAQMKQLRTFQYGASQD